MILACTVGYSFFAGATYAVQGAHRFQRGDLQTMFKKHKICVVVPAYKEEDHIGNVLKTIPELVDHVIVVDDGSPDKTFQEAIENGDARVIVVRHRHNKGVGAAIVTGHRKAIELGAEISVVMAGDGQMNPEYITKLLYPIIEQGYDYVKGNRFLKRGNLQNMPRIRIIGNIILSLLTIVASGYWNIFDSQNGYTAIKTNVLKKLNMSHLNEDFQFENDVLVHLNILNARVKDVQIPSCYQGEKSKIDLFRFIKKTSFFLVKAFFRRIQAKSKHTRIGLLQRTRLT